MTLLAVGLIAAGFGTAVFLRTSLISSLDAQLESLASTDVASGLIEIDTSTTPLRFAVKSDGPATDYVVALYGPTGELIIQTGGDGTQSPALPESWTLQQTIETGVTPFFLPSADGAAGFHASVDTFPIEGVGDLYTQLVTLPVAPINRVVANYIGIYSILAVVILIGSAFLTRFLVTLTFRSLGQVETTAMAIAGGDFSLRMTDIEPTRTEVGRLKMAINAMLRRVDAAISQRDATVRQMRRFIGDASHELRTPLVTVRGYAELHRMGALPTDEDVTQAMDRIEKEAIRMGVLVEDLLALARLDERQDVVSVPIDLRPIARDAAMDVRAAAPLRPVTVVDTTAEGIAPSPDAADSASSAAHEADPRTPPPASAIARAGGATLSLLRRKPRPVPAVRAAGAGELPPVAPVAPAAVAGPEPIVLGDENRIRQVVANLLGNARRFTAEDSPIEVAVGVDRDAGMGWIAIVDHGEGIPEQIREKIFQRFWRADTSRARETGGSGLGLSIVASIVESLHGSVDVTDTPGGGATFRVSFRLAQERDAEDHLSIETRPLPRLSDES